MSRNFAFLLFILLISGCAKDPSRFNKKETIPRRQFVSILAEMHLMDAITNHHEYYNKYTTEDTLDIYGSIYGKYGYTRRDFDSTISNYTRRPQLYDRVYNDVLMKLNYMLDTLDWNDARVKKEDVKRQMSTDEMFY